MDEEIKREIPRLLRTGVLTLIVGGALGLYAIQVPAYGLNPLKWKEGREIFKQKVEQREARISELSTLVEDVLKKAEFEDGGRGFSFSDGVKMAYALGDTRIIREGQPIRLYVAEDGWTGDGLFAQNLPDNNPAIFLNIGNSRNWEKIDEEKAKAYLKK